MIKQKSVSTTDLPHTDENISYHTNSPKNYLQGLQGLEGGTLSPEQVAERVVAPIKPATPSPSQGLSISDIQDLAQMMERRNITTFEFHGLKMVRTPPIKKETAVMDQFEQLRNLNSSEQDRLLALGQLE